MRSRSAIWFECKVCYEKTMEDGMPKKVVETYVVDAVSFGEAEERIIEEMSAYVSGDLEIKDLKIAQYGEVFFAGGAAQGDNGGAAQNDAGSDLADKWFKAKVAFITIDEGTDKEKKTNNYYLVNAGDIDAANKNIDEVLGGTMIDYEKCAVSETNIMDVFEYKPKEKGE